MRNACSKELEKYQIKYFTLHVKELEKRRTDEPQSWQKKQNNKGVEINEFNLN